MTPQYWPQGYSRSSGASGRRGRAAPAYGCFGVLYSASFWNGSQTVS